MSDDKPVEGEKPETKADEQKPADVPATDAKGEPDKVQDKPVAGDPATGPVKDPAAAPDKSMTEAAQEGAVLPQEHAESEPVQVGERQGMFGSSLGNDTTGYGGLQKPILFPGASPKPYGREFDQVTDDLGAALARAGGPAYDDAVERVVVDRGELTLFVRREHLVGVARALRDEPSMRYEMCTGVSGVHYPQETGAELHAVYHLLSITHGSRRVRLEVTCPDSDRHIPSVVAVYPGIDWHERETWDMFGIEFDGHPALTRILMPDDWPGHPQRKDYPLGGIPVEYKGATVPPADERRSYS